ncbi:hypothetical protein [Conexivisphaera calida]|uniref:DUF8196 domain-containing protein n=1 Tax=Conexivisphaera calida TaxID=1874277 RepID=A0A4P2VFT6_9ARCH|nr:hypothetical protein [Conexivisphaera calida]BBE42797.1 hypothetical protein NAS2_1410 [Conexivisphaera calida]
MPRAGSSLRAQLLDLLDRDKEFRYAVAGKLGLSEILERLDRNEEAIRRLWEEVRALREGQEKLWGEVKALREGQEKLAQGQEKLWENYEKLSQGQEKLWGEVKALREGQEKLAQGQEKLWGEVKALREGQEKLAQGQEKLWENYEKLARDMHDVKSTLNRLTATEEEESREVVSYRLRNDMGISMELSNLRIDDREIDLYGASGDICVVGEATVRLGKGLVEELDEKVELMRRARPDLLRPRLVKVIYTLTATPEALDEAKKRGVWVLKIDRDLVPRPSV